MKLAVQDSFPVITVYLHMPTTVWKAEGPAVVMMSVLDIWRKGASVELPQWCRKGKKNERKKEQDISNLRKFNGVVGYQKVAINLFIYWQLDR